MMFFLVCATCLIAIGVVAVVYPLVRPPVSGADDSQSSQNIDIAKQQLKNLEESYGLGEVDDPEYTELRSELEQTLAIELSQERDYSETQLAVGNPNIILPVILAFVFPIATGLIYVLVGEPKAITIDNSVSTQQVAVQGTQAGQDVDKLMNDLRDRLSENPDDARGWTIFARSSMALENYADAIRGYERVNSLEPNNPEILVQYADALAMLSGGVLQGKPDALLKQALKLNPDQPQGLWLGGMAAQRRGEYQVALDLWARLMPQLDEDPETRAQLIGLLEELRTNAARDNITLVEKALEPSVQGTSNSQASIEISISLAEQLYDQVDPEMFVFIFARPEGGPPMPVASARIKVKDLPAKVVLTDENAMIPELRLSKFETVNVTARISKSGQPIAQSGDLEAHTNSVSVQNSKPLELIISTVRQ